jgi:hypothetical protein
MAFLEDQLSVPDLSEEDILHMGIIDRAAGTYEGRHNMSCLGWYR